MSSTDTEFWTKKKLSNRFKQNSPKSPTCTACNSPLQLPDNTYICSQCNLTFAANSMIAFDHNKPRIYPNGVPAINEFMKSQQIDLVAIIKELSVESDGNQSNTAFRWHADAKEFKQVMEEDGIPKFVYEQHIDEVLINPTSDIKDAFVNMNILTKYDKNLITKLKKLAQQLTHFCNFHSSVSNIILLNTKTEAYNNHHNDDPSVMGIVAQNLDTLEYSISCGKTKSVIIKPKQAYSLIGKLWSEHTHSYCTFDKYVVRILIDFEALYYGPLHIIDVFDKAPLVDIDFKNETINIHHLDNIVNDVLEDKNNAGLNDSEIEKKIKNTHSKFYLRKNHYHRKQLLKKMKNKNNLKNNEIRYGHKVFANQYYYFYKSIKNQLTKRKTQIK
eukprot:527876_1